MGRKYLKPPLEEAVCEFRFTEDTPWDMTIPGLLYDKIKDTFPIKEKRKYQESLIRQDKDGAIQEVSVNDAMGFLSLDKKAQINLRNNCFSINYLKPYPTWGEVLPVVERVYYEVQGLIHIEGISRLGLRYINRIVLPDEKHISLSKYFEFGLRLGEGLPKNMTGFSASAILEMPDGSNACLVRMARAAEDPLGENTILLDMDFYSKSPLSVEPDHAIEWVKNAHDQVEKIFENCINDRLRAIFEEVKNAD
jgi:uncharacterized protein (TIGR04255 family)